MPASKGISTQIRNFYSEGNAYLNVRYYNTNLSFQIYPYAGTDSNNRPVYDMKSSLTTTVGFENAYALYKTCEDIVEDKVQEVLLKVPCMSNASIILERKLNQSNIYESTLSITKNDKMVSFKFATLVQQVKENGVPTTKLIESGIGSFMMTLAGYLVSINASHHLDKVMAEYERKQNEAQMNNSNNSFRNNNNNFTNLPFDTNNNGYKHQDFTSFNPIN